MSVISRRQSYFLARCTVCMDNMVFVAEIFCFSNKIFKTENLVQALIEENSFILK